MLGQRKTHQSKTNQLEFLWPKPVQLLSVGELYDSLNLERLAELGEDNRFERKPPGIHVSALSEYLSMFANTKPDGGIVAVGIEDDGTVSGCGGLSHNEINSLERCGDTHCADARYEVKKLPILDRTGNDTFLLVFRVFYREDKVVVTNGGKAFFRRGASKTRLNQEAIRELQLDKGEVDLELEPCKMLRYPDDFELSLIDDFASAFIKSRDLQNVTSREEVLVLRHLGRNDGGVFHANSAGVLLFAKDPSVAFPGAKIRFLRFDGEHEGSGQNFNPVKDIWIEGNVPSVIQAAERILDSQLRDFSRLGSDGKFYAHPEYPKLAWYEAIVNACVHRSYGLRNMNIFIKMFDDRLIVESPGGFPGLVNSENIYDMHHPRNPHLMEAMFYLKFVKCAHEGTRRMRDTMAGSELPEPEFRQRELSHALVQVTLRNNLKQRRVWIDSDATEIVGETISKRLSADEKRIVNFAAEHGKINVSQIQRLLQRSWPYSKKLLGRLESMKILRSGRRDALDRDPQAFYELDRPEPEEP